MLDVGRSPIGDKYVDGNKGNKFEVKRDGIG
jgi:hypothetical protein